MCHSFSDLQILVPTFDFKYSSPQGEGQGQGLGAAAGDFVLRFKAAASRAQPMLPISECRPGSCQDVK